MKSRLCFLSTSVNLCLNLIKLLKVAVASKVALQILLH